MSISLEKGDKAPDFELSGSDGLTYNLDSFRDKTLVLYFYPKDNTTGCTTEAIEFSSFVDEFNLKNAQVVGISPDSVKSHCNFIDKHSLRILLLNDSDKKVAELYGAFGEKKMYGKTVKGIIRSTFIIRDGKILESFYNVKAKGHAENVLGFLKAVGQE